MNDIDQNRLDIRLSKALNFISQDEKRELWNHWGKKKYGAIYVIKSDEDLERVIELGGIPNSPKKAVYISVARSLASNLDPGKYLIKVWSEKLPHIKNPMQPLSGGVSYPFINVEFFDDNSDSSVQGGEDD